MADDREYVAAQKHGREGNTLRGVEVVDSERVAAPLIARPHTELGFRFLLPLARLVLRKPESFAVDAALQKQPAPDDVRAVGLDGARRDRRAHIQHPRALAQRHVVRVDVLLRRTAHRVKPFQGTAGIARARLAVSVVQEALDDAVCALDRALCWFLVFPHVVTNRGSPRRRPCARSRRKAAPPTRRSPVQAL